MESRITQGLNIQENICAIDRPPALLDSVSFGVLVLTSSTLEA